MKKIGFTSNLDFAGLQVYCVFISYVMVGKPSESINGIALSKCLFYGPKDIYVEATALNNNNNEIGNRKDVINSYLDSTLLMAEQGYLFACVYNLNGSNPEFRSSDRCSEWKPVSL
ncbi:hypothetical protein [Salipaludibacillus sp. CF4.18]|uniref:hypothetical protein n=1 Tax=Salipaludibacillus sp. CF4.18 TaxID=3373081 RepID=UPI003EE5940F